MLRMRFPGHAFDQLLETGVVIDVIPKKNICRLYKVGVERKVFSFDDKKSLNPLFARIESVQMTNLGMTTVWKLIESK